MKSKERSPITINKLNMTKMLPRESKIVGDYSLSGRIKRIHVNKRVIAQNAAHERNDPPLTVKTARSNDYGHEVDIQGPSKVVYSPDKPLDCGAKLWIETRAVVVIRNGRSVIKVI
jgi:hypothetical protein